MSRRFLALLVVLGPIALVVLAVSASPLISQPIDTVTLDGAPQAADPTRPDVPCLVVPSAPETYTTTEWQMETPMPTGRHDFGLAAQPGSTYLYAFGGVISATDMLTSTERYNTCSQQWEALAPLPQPRGYIMAVEIDGKYYVVGGVDQVVSGTFGVQNTTYVFDPVTNAWTQLADLPQALGGVMAATVNGKLYAFGGFDARGYNHGNVDTTYEYNPATNTWLTRTALISGTRSLAGAASLNGKIYLVGGITDGDPYTATLGSTIIYDPTSDTWQLGASGSRNRSLALTVAPDNAIYAFGGEGGEGGLNSRYDPVRNQWDQPRPTSLIRIDRAWGRPIRADACSSWAAMSRSSR